MGINLSHWQSEMEELQPGDTIRVDHGSHCTAGEETRRRLYLTRVMSDPERVVGYCHNCAEGGIYTDSGQTAYRNTRHANFYKDRYPTIVEEVVPPTGLVFKMAEWPTYAQSWAMNNKLADGLLSKYNIAFDPSTDRVYLPRYRIVGDMTSLCGYQLRIVTGKGPKYITVSSRDDPGYSLIHKVSDQVIIVEDLVSGIHVHEASDEAVIVNYGVKINPLVVSVATKFYKALVWLDNDSPHVVAQAKGYARTIGLYGSTQASVVMDESDPKHYSPDGIRNIMVTSW
jgi:hypothetical protein